MPKGKYAPKKQTAAIQVQCNPHPRIRTMQHHSSTGTSTKRIHHTKPPKPISKRDKQAHVIHISLSLCQRSHGYVVRGKL
ncbi:hypothetical protein CY34DRAFT_802108 [Suillus luteus UH-Slu-Lm8-n1]|uniref:Uncharacterized protein n=1 Tax=Suillus luteus UH-Slu-Lm8-n1 TaxID=930992 RepID=A0A0D0ATK8_9AGAM|nr:hypothetical protein CY34DRAFT_802108 [Suillus luteus UH-Slu-Lm8-n1]